MKRERRTFELMDIRAEETDESAGTLTGHAAVFDKKTEIAGLFTESIAPGAFARALREDHDVVALFNHDPNYPLARASAGNLKMREDKKGLATEISPTDTSYAKDLLKNVRAGVVRGMSFGFVVTEEEWSEKKGNKPHRTIKDLDLFDVSPVVYPQYKQTDISAREARSVMIAAGVSGANDNPVGDAPAEEAPEAAPGPRQVPISVLKAKLDLASQQ